MIDWYQKLESAARELLEKDYSNMKGDGICPCCKVSGCEKQCALGKLRRLMGIPTPKRRSET